MLVIYSKVSCWLKSLQASKVINNLSICMYASLKYLYLAKKGKLIMNNTLFTWKGEHTAVLRAYAWLNIRNHTWICSENNMWSQGAN